MLVHTITEYGVSSRLAYAFGSMERMLSKTAIPCSEPSFREQKDAAGEYTFVPLEPTMFVRQLHIASQLTRGTKKAKPKFIDVGCGIGTKLVLAQSILSSCWTFCGIDTTPEYINVAKKLFPEAQLEVKNALEYDYSDFEIIYFYCPMFKEDLQRQLERRILKTAKSGTVIIANLKKLSHKLWLRSTKAENTDGYIFVRK